MNNVFTIFNISSKESENISVFSLILGSLKCLLNTAIKFEIHVDAITKFSCGSQISVYPQPNTCLHTNTFAHSNTDPRGILVTPSSAPPTKESKSLANDGALRGDGLLKDNTRDKDDDPDGVDDFNVDEIKSLSLPELL